MKQATQKGAASDQQPPSKENEQVEVKRSARDLALDALGARQDESRRAQVDDDVANDPGAATLRGRIEADQKRNREAAEADGLLERAVEQGVTSVEKIEQPAEDALPENLQNDPLAEFIKMDGDKPMFVMKVNGEQKSIPLSEARKKLQIGTAAEIRMQNAAAKEKEVAAREAKILASEQALAARAKKNSSTPAIPELNEEELRKEAAKFMSSAFTDDEDVAADKLTKLLLKTRIPSAAPFDEAAIVEKTASVVREGMTKTEREKDLILGYSKLKDEYPEIFEDVNLYNATDRLVDEIAAEHPEWPMSQAMLEAGKRTREWVSSLKGNSQNEETDEEQTDNTGVPSSITEIRQERKTGLVRLPQTAGSAVQPSAKDAVSEVQSPQEALDEIRRARGQPI